MPDYPMNASVAIDPNAKYKPAVLAAVRRFAATKPWRGTLDERRAKFEQANRDLGEALAVEPPLLVFAGDGDGDSGASSYCPATNTITMQGRQSVITFCHEWGHRIHGRSDVKACRWSLNLFRRCFPLSWSKLRFEGHMARRDNIRSP